MCLPFFSFFTFTLYPTPSLKRGVKERLSGVLGKVEGQLRDTPLSCSLVEITGISYLLDFFVHCCCFFCHENEKQHIECRNGQ